MLSSPLASHLGAGLVELKQPRQTRDRCGPNGPLENLLVDARRSAIPVDTLAIPAKAMHPAPVERLDEGPGRRREDGRPTLTLVQPEGGVRGRVAPAPEGEQEFGEQGGVMHPELAVAAGRPRGP